MLALSLLTQLTQRPACQMAQSLSKDKGEQIFVIFNVPAGCKPSDTADPGGVSAHVACGPHPD